MKVYLMIPLSNTNVLKKCKTAGERVTVYVYVVYALLAFPLCLAFLTVEIFIRVLGYVVTCGYCWCNRNTLPAKYAEEEAAKAKGGGAAELSPQTGVSVVDVKLEVPEPAAGGTRFAEGTKPDDGPPSPAHDFREKSRARRHRDIPTFLEIVYLMGRSPCGVLKNYAWAMSWKFVNWLKLTLGYWVHT